ncbi:DUF2161 family putative PD-(D/E)XK-type phosphodiesterase [Bacillus sp. 31A1R]|uniref:DUF2161 family putative PD-(D/E)XK-type phosphodiesterase n=1 Tax=Robertmurraya mangrovi TaxID=3098077 RepID=A0ABU5IWL0_9BACI|nr:DUF2161 family putative PD-(D/E)XK-type phosphodiesterase [Bacillus sp. 31A1R]MDZ5471534.1 DUF2161 family putative PD-(D/E)XK-type phosphodiesterase [Bacillus sp. 31A1R]
MASKQDKLYEVDLYKPIQQYFTKLGYIVHGEVNHCDMTAVKNDELIIIELKKNLNIDLLIQATKRQRITDLVYIGIPKPKRLSSKKYYEICHLARRLEIGLIMVSFKRKTPSVEVCVSPEPFERSKSLQRNKKKREKILAEIEGRNGDYNIGGSNKTKIMTAYKENCIHIATILDQLGPLSPKKLRQMNTGDKTLSILYQNHYGWFDKVQRGIYCLSTKGKEELSEFPELVEYYKNLHQANDEQSS